MSRMSLWRPALFPVLALLALGGCGDDEPDLATPAACNPLGGARCVTPWPSSIYQDSLSGQLQIPAGALPANIDGVPIDPAPYNARDGFSSAVPIVIAFAGGIDPSNLVPFTDYPASLTAASPTVLVDLETGALVPHFAELDVSGAATPDSQALFVRPAAMLAGSRRYAVAIRRTLRAPGGGPLAIPEGYQAILDGRLTTHAGLERVRPHYPEIFAALAAHGIAPEDLVTAWQFSTASRDSVRADLLGARDAAAQLHGANGSALTYTVTSDAPTDDPRIARLIRGTFDAPLVLTNGGSTAASTQLLRDASGAPMTAGVYRVPFTAIVPTCVQDDLYAHPLLVYGHGLLGTSEQAAGGGARIAADALCAIVIGTDLRGMSTADVPNVALALNDPNQHTAVFDGLIQGMVNHFALSAIARGPMLEGLFARPGGGSMVSYGDIHFYGISQGGIMGTTVCGFDPVIGRCILQVGAANYSLLLERSRDWIRYQAALVGAFPDPLDAVLVINLLQHAWDRSEATSVSDVLLRDGVSGVGGKQVLMQIAIADDEVSNVASAYQMRTLGIPVLTPSPSAPYDVATTAGPAASAAVFYDFGLGATIPAGNQAPPDNDVHGNVRDKQATMDMMKRFLETGEIVQTCTAPTGCDCVAGGCGATL